jgi:hypothetical protein
VRGGVVMQASFAQALLNPDLPAVDEHGRFNVYRNNLRITLRNALRTTADTDNFRMDSEASAIAALDIPAMLHPSVSVVFSENPALSIWRAQLEPDAAPPIPDTTETTIIWRQDDLVAEMLANVDDEVLLRHFAQSQTFTALIAEYPDDRSAETLIVRFINLAIAGIIVPAHTTIEGEMK